MKINKFIKAIVGLYLTSIFFISCEETKIATEIDSAEVNDIEFTAELFNLDAVEEATNFQETLKNNLKIDDFTCMNITVHENENQAFWPHSVTVDFGVLGCADAYGNIYKGKIHILQTNYWNVEGATRTTTFEDFYVNLLKIEGAKTVTNQGLNSEGNLTFQLSITNGKVSLNDLLYVTYNSSHTWELVEGAQTHSRLDNVINITGTSTGKHWTGSTYSKNILTPLRKPFICRVPVSGSQEIIIDLASPIVLDFGNGTCDDLVTITQNGVSKEYSLSEQFKKLE